MGYLLSKQIHYVITAAKYKINDYGKRFIFLSWNCKLEKSVVGDVLWQFYKNSI